MPIFFLRLYKSILADIKYFQNEITNIEAKMLAINVSLISDGNKFLENVVDSLAKTERNFVLSSGQTTIELEREKIDAQSGRNTLEMLKDLWSSKRSE